MGKLDDGGGFLAEPWASGPPLPIAAWNGPTWDRNHHCLVFAAQKFTLVLKMKSPVSWHRKYNGGTWKASH